MSHMHAPTIARHRVHLKAEDGLIVFLGEPVQKRASAYRMDDGGSPPARAMVIVISLTS